MTRLLTRLRVLVVKELRDLARDRKVFYAAILLPALLFPLLLSFAGRLLSTTDQAPVGMRIGLIGHGEVVDDLVREGSWASWAAGGDEDRVRSGELDAVLIADHTGRRLTKFRVIYDRSNSQSALASEKILADFATVTNRARRRALARGDTDWSEIPPEDIEFTDLAAYVHNGIPSSSNFLPSMLVLMMLAAAAFAAIDLFPGERERGTLETLLVQPIRAEEVLLGKYLAVFATGYIAVLANLAGVALASSLASSPLRIPLTFTSLFGAAAIALPTSALIAAVLVRIVARAHSVREAQHYLLPLTLVSMIPALLAAAPEMKFDAFTACIPLVGPSLGFRELAVGQIHPVALLLMVVTTAIYSALVLRGAMRFLAHEEAILSDGSSDGHGSRVIAVALFAILGTFVCAPFLRAAPPLVAIVVPLVIFTALPAVLFGSSVGLQTTLNFSKRRTRARSWVLAISTGIGIALLVTGVASVQRGFLKPPAAFDEAGQALLAGFPSLGVALFALAIVPAIAEELLYRRFVLHGLRTELERNRAILATAALFALHHLSIFRFLPSFVAGIVLGRLVLRSHRFWLAPVAHATSNAIMVLLAHPQSPLVASDLARFFGNERLAIARIALGAAIVLFTPWLLERRHVWTPARMS